MRRAKPQPPNLLELRPRRAVDWEAGENDHVVLLVPRFRHPLLARWLLPLLPSRSFRVRLDRYGSFIWRMCDGATRVEDIAEKMLGVFGPEVEPVYHRIGRFLSKLEREDLLVVRDPATESGLA